MHTMLTPRKIAKPLEFRQCGRITLALKYDHIDEFLRLRADLIRYIELTRNHHSLTCPNCHKIERFIDRFAVTFESAHCHLRTCATILMTCVITGDELL
jgi:hypothetical protein